MAYNEQLANRIKQALLHLPQVEEKKMFGGLAFIVNGKMCLTARKDRIMCRLDPVLHEQVIKREGSRTVIMKGREYKGYIHVDEGSLQTSDDFDYWIKLALDFNKKLTSADNL